MAWMERPSRRKPPRNLPFLPNNPPIVTFLEQLEKQYAEPVELPAPFADAREELARMPGDALKQGKTKSRHLRIDIALLYYGLLCRSLLVLATGVREISSLRWRFPDHSLELGWLDDQAERVKTEILDGLVADWWRAGRPLEPEDPLRPVYEEILSSATRRRRGEFYTPGWLVDLLVDRVWAKQKVWLDPSCGSGSFAWGIARREARETDGHSRFVGLDRNPWSVLAAAANTALATAYSRTQRRLEDFTLPVACLDVIVDATLRPLAGCCDRIVGNPPWLLWDRMEEEYRRATEPSWRHYGLFIEKGMNTILGGGKKDLAMLMTYAAADRYLARGGFLAFVITQSVFKGAGSARGFRRFELPGGRPLAVRHVDDVDALKPFPNVGAKAAILILEGEARTEYPVPYHVWDSVGHGRDHLASPANENDSLGAWKHVPTESREIGQAVLGKCEYQARLGVNTGGANGVYWFERLESLPTGWRVRNLVERGKRIVERKEVLLESDLLFPLLMGKEVRAWNAVPSAWILMVQDVDRQRGMDRECLLAKAPRSLAYLESFEGLLRTRAAFRRYFLRTTAQGEVETGDFYSMFNVGGYTLAPVKVVWNRMGHRLAAAVVTPWEGKPVLPQETHCFFPCASEAEAHYLAALLNSSSAQTSVAMIGQVGGKSFATPSTMHRLRLVRFDSDNPLHQSLAAAGMRAHDEAAVSHHSTPSRDTSTRVNRLAREYWAIGEGP